MIAKVELANGNVEFAEVNQYAIGTELHPAVIRITVYDKGKKICSKTRKHSFIYKHFTFKTKEVQDQIEEFDKRMREQMVQQAQQNIEKNRAAMQQMQQQEQQGQ